MVEVRGLIKERGWVPEPCLGLAGPGHQSPAKKQGRGNRMVEGSGSSTKRFQMAVGTEAAGAFQSLGGSSLALVLPLQTFRPPTPPAIQHILAAKEASGGLGEKEDGCRVGVCRASASEGCLRRAGAPADPETSVWKLENVTQKEPWRRRGHSSGQRASSAAAQGTAGREPVGLGWATALRTPDVLDG